MRICIALPIALALFCSACNQSAPKKATSTAEATASQKDTQEELADPSDEKYVASYKHINTLRDKNATLAQHADSLYHLTQEALAYLDSLKGLLPTADSNRENTSIAGKLFANQATESRIDQYTTRINNLVIAGLVHPEKKALIDYVMDELKYMRQKGWTRSEFEDVPVYVATTTLNSLAVHYKKMAEVALDDMEGGVGN